MTEPSPPGNLAETLLDPGRQRPLGPPRPNRGAALAETLLDEGRRRPPPGDGATDWPEAADALPERLAQRYKLIRRLDVTASQADLSLVRVRDSGEEVLLKRYRTGRDPHPDVVAYLSAPRDHIVRYLEFGPGYDVMEYAAGGGLLDREADPAGFDFATLREIAQQVSAALIGMHRHNLVHRDIKPANIVLRSTAPLDVAVVDVGLAGPPNDTHRAERPNPAYQMNPSYQPPESILDGRFGLPGDWWALGMTLLELAAGVHPFEGLAPEDIRDHFVNGRSVDVSGIPDEPRPSGGAGRRDRLRSLCQGLLTTDTAARWGEREVSDWLVGRDPLLPGVAPRPQSVPVTAPVAAAAGGGSGPAQVAAGRPYVFNGAEYHFRDDLAQALATAWNHAVDVLLTRPGGLDGLRAWLEQSTDDEGRAAHRAVAAAGAAADEPGHVRLLRVVRALDPTRPAIYRHHVISRRNLRAIAHRAARNEADAGSVLADLWSYRLLPTFDSAVPVAPDSGAEGFADLDREWRAERDRWRDAAAQVADPDARRHLARPELRPAVLAISLRAALRDPDDVAAAHEEVRRAAAGLPAPVPWFSGLARRPELVWLALLLSPYATGQARSAADRRAAELAQTEALRASALFREWSRRQNRPVALGWAAAGVCLMAAGWIALIAASDAAGRAGDAAIGLAWAGASVCAAVALVVEGLLAAEVGGRFHPRYSIPGAGVLALGPLGRWMQRAWLPASVASLAALAGIALAAVHFPQAIAAITSAGHLLWTVRRWHAWGVQSAAEDALIAAAADRGPSDADGTPTGATRGVGT